MNVLLTVVSLLLIFLSVLPLLRSGRWWIRVWDFPRLQLATGLAAMLLAHIALCTFSTAEWFLFTALAVCLLYQTAQIVPYTPLARKQVLVTSTHEPDTSFGLLVANVRMDNRKAMSFVELIRNVNPDIVLINEPDHWWEQQLRPLDSVYPYHVKIPQENTYGMILYSKLPIRSHKIHYLVEPDIPSIQSLIELRSGDVMELFSVHPRPPLPESDTEDRDAELLFVGRLVRATFEPSIVAGDMNDVAWSRTTSLFQKVSGLLDPRVGRGLYNSFHAQIPFMRWPLDHVFHSPAFRLEELRRLDNCGSDHFPLYVRLSYEPRGRAEQMLPPPEEEEKREAKRIVRNVMVRRSAI
jgi:endonuclease/exonuclease/phosphatase (EEP) superfamily protein YafD